MFLFNTKQAIIIVILLFEKKKLKNATHKRCLRGRYLFAGLNSWWNRMVEVYSLFNVSMINDCNKLPKQKRINNIIY